MADPGHRPAEIATGIRTPRARDALLPLGAGVVVVYLSFHAGGYFPGSTGLVAAVLLLLLAVWIVVVDRPFSGFGRGSVIAASALGLLALWTLVSRGWSDAPARALVEYDRVLLYLAGFALFHVLGRRGERLRWMVRGVAAAAVVVCLCGLITRLFPNVWQLAPEVATQRLNYPLTYWNSMGLMAALGIVLCFGLTADPRESTTGRVWSAAALPILAVSLVLTFSRGSIAAGLAGLLALIVVGRPRALPGALLAVVPAAGLAVAAGYSAPLLATDQSTTAAAAAQGQRAGIVVALCVAMALVVRWKMVALDAAPIAGRRLPERLKRPATVWCARVGLCVALSFGVLVWPVSLPDQYDSFVNGDSVNSADFRERLGSSGDNGRIVHWRAALGRFDERPWTGTGAGTYPLQWDRVGENDKLELQDAHSLYIEVLGELGLIGLLLVVVVVGSVLVGFLLVARGTDRVLGATLFGTGLAWALAAGVDWVWEMPAVTFWFFAAGGLAMAARDHPPVDAGGERARRPLSRPLRLAIAAGCLMLAVAPLRVFLSDGRLRDGVRAFDRNDCATTVDRSLDSIAMLGVRPEPYVLLGYCDVRLGRPTLAIAAMNKAMRRDPHSWEVHYALALARAAAGLDPRVEFRAARRLNPRDPLIAETLRLFDTDSPQEWRRRARGARLPPA